MKRLTPHLLILCYAAFIGGCASFPEVDAAMQATNDPAPKLIAVDAILAQADTIGRGEAATQSVSARAAALRAKAARLRQM